MVRATLITLAPLLRDLARWEHADGTPQREAYEAVRAKFARLFALPAAGIGAGAGDRPGR